MAMEVRRKPLAAGGCSTQPLLGIAVPGYQQRHIACVVRDPVTGGRRSETVGYTILTGVWEEHADGHDPVTGKGEGMIIGYLLLDGWEGRTRQQVEVIGQTPKRYRIRAIDRTRLAGPRWLNPGETALVPKTAMRDNCAKCHGKRGGVPGNENVVNGLTLCDHCSQESGR